MAKKTVKKTVKKDHGQDGHATKEHGQDGRATGGRATGGRATGRRSALVDTRVVFSGETKEKRAFEDRHASTKAYIEFSSTRM